MFVFVPPSNLPYANILISFTNNGTDFVPRPYFTV